MKQRLTRLLALVMVTLIIIVSVPFVEVSAATTVKNWGTREQVCTSLSEYAIDYYADNNTSYEQLASSSNVLSALQSLMRTTHTYTSSYDDCHNKANITDCENSDGRVSLIYSSYSASMSDWAGSGGNGWNREHVWPKSLAGNTTSGGGADLHHIRPSDAKINSTRNNDKYGYVSNKSEVSGTDKFNNVKGGYSGGGYFEPYDNVKGDVARIILYVYVRWNSDWGATSLTKVFQSVDVLLEWCALDPVDTWEMGRNDAVESIQGNRNVFIDYPELAWELLDRDAPDDMTTPSQGAHGGNSNIPAADSKLTIPQANELGLSKSSGSYTTGKYYVSGVISEISNPLYGNMKITDSSGNVFTVNGSYSADGSTRYDAMAEPHKVGDHVTVYGVIGQYNGEARMKDGWVTVNTVVVPPAANSTVTIAEALAIGQSMDSGVYTEDKYYVNGVITEISNPIYGNMKITDSSGNVFTVNGSYSADGSTRYDSMATPHEVGDTVTVYGVIGQYNGTAQMKSGWVTVIPDVTEDSTESTDTESVEIETTEEATEETTEVITDEPTTEQPTDEPTEEPTEEQTTEKQTTEETDEPSTEAKDDETESETETDEVKIEISGCGSSLSGGFTIITVVAVAAFVSMKKKREE